MQSSAHNDPQLEYSREAISNRQAAGANRQLGTERLSWSIIGFAVEVTNVVSRLVPTRMRAVVLKGHGGFEQLEYREDWPVPNAGPGEVLIRVGASAVNNTDINTRVGWYSKSAGNSFEPASSTVDDGAWGGNALRFPRIQGADACGEIVAVGAGVDSNRIGQRVLVDPMMLDGNESLKYVGSECDGAFAEYIKVPTQNAYAISSSLSDAELASFPCSYATAEGLVTRAQVVAGERVLVTGASGGVGSGVVQLARRRGAHVFAVAGSSKRSVITELGAERVISREANLSTEIGAESVDVVIDVVGGSAFAGLLAVLRQCGRYAVAGAVGGPFVDLDLRTLYLKDLTLLGCTRQPSGTFRRLVEYIERGEIRPLVGEIYPLRDIVAAQEAFLKKRHVGKIVLSVRDT